MARFLRICLLIMFAIGCHPRINLFAQNKIIAIVNNDTVTQKDLDDFTNFMRMELSAEFKGGELENKIEQIKPDLLNKLIEDKLILQEAKKSNINIDPSKINSRINEIKKRYASETEFQNDLLMQGLTQKDIEQRIKEQMLTYVIVEEKTRRMITVSPTEVTKFYEDNKEMFRLPPQRNFNYIITGDQNLAWEVFNALRRGEDIDEVSRNNALALNQINIIHEGRLRKEIETEILKLKPGEISIPIRQEDSFYIFKLNQITPSRQQSLQEAQDNLYKFLFEKKAQEKFADWINNLKGHSHIEILR